MQKAQATAGVKDVGDGERERRSRRKKWRRRLVGIWARCREGGGGCNDGKKRCKACCSEEEKREMQTAIDNGFGKWGVIIVLQFNIFLKKKIVK